MKFTKIITAICLILVLSILFLSARISLEKVNLPIEKIKINDAVINAEIAVQPKDQIKGLGDRVSLPENSGMLFVFSSKSRQTFWMKDMRFGLDFIWINDNKIVDITPNVPAPSDLNQPLSLYQPQSEVNYVLEVNAGFCAKHKIKVGDEVIFEVR